MIESAFEGKRNMTESAFKGKCSKVLSNEKEACSSSDFERSVALRRYKKQARAVISSAQRPKSKLEQRFRAPSGYGARSSNDFERSVEEATPVLCFRVLSRQYGLIQRRVERRIYCIICSPPPHTLSHLFMFSAKSSMDTQVCFLLFPEASDRHLSRNINNTSSMNLIVFFLEPFTDIEGIYTMRFLWISWSISSSF